MGKFYDEIPERMFPWIQRQKMFWVATAPLSPEGHVNVSPKGVEGTFHLVDSKRVWYEDLTGSGVETISHLRENGRVTILFNAFDGAANICRLFGRGTFHEFGTPEYNQYITPDIRTPGSRAVIVIDVHKVGTSCGWGVPLYEFKSNRTKIVTWTAKLEKEEAKKLSEGYQGSFPLEEPVTVKKYWEMEGLESIDGLPAMTEGHKSSQVPVVRDFDLNPDMTRKNKEKSEQCLSGLGDSKETSRAISQVKELKQKFADPAVLFVFILGLVIGVIYEKRMHYEAMDALKIYLSGS